MTFGAAFGSDAVEARRIFDAYVERGGNFIDTANSYAKGDAETMVGDFAHGRRQRLVVATKYSLGMSAGDPNASGNHRKNMLQSVEASLRRLRTDYIDLLYLHMWDGMTPVEEILRGLDDLVRQGKIVYAGMSDVPAWQVSRMQAIADIRGWTPLVALQVRYNLADRAVERDLIPMAVELGLGVMPWAPLAMGVLSGKYARDVICSDSLRRDMLVAAGMVTPRALAIAAVVQQVADGLGVTAPQVAIAWLLARDAVAAPILGARTLTQFEDNVGALALKLDDAQLEQLHAASAIDLGFPHDFLASKVAQKALFAGISVRPRNAQA
jgi:aryl-alcohol dehydrogenase-like predicted oxidoreductase